MFGLHPEQPRHKLAELRGCSHQQIRNLFRLHAFALTSPVSHEFGVQFGTLSGKRRIETFGQRLQAVAVIEVRIREARYAKLGQGSIGHGCIHLGHIRWAG